MRMQRSIWFTTIALTGIFTQDAQAWDPASGADVAVYQQAGTLPNYVVPQRYYRPIAQPSTYAPSATVAVPSAPVAAPVYTIPGAPAPVAYAAPLPAAPAPVATPDASPAEVAPASQPVYREANNGLMRRNRYSVGLEATYGNYEEPETFPSLHMDSYSGGITGSFTRYLTPHWFAGLDSRLAYGTSDYYSSQGHAANIPEWESDSRITTGYDVAVSSNAVLRPYAGVGGRFYFDNGKGIDTDQGANGYDRRIWQVYMPLGVTYEWMRAGVTFAPTLEVDPLIYGQVQSRLGEIPGYSNAVNEQHSGMGYRAQMMIGQRDASGKGWEFGPFFRYWDIPDSDTTTITTPSGSSSAIEPRNNRFQAGAHLKYLF